MSDRTADADPVRFADVRPLLEPRSVAVIGASDAPGNLGGIAVRHLRRFGFPGPVFPVNPRREAVGGLPCHRSVADLPEPVDLAIIGVGESNVLGAIEACAAAGIRYGIVWAGGFAEGGPEGIVRQEALVRLCRTTGFQLLGPNCIGAINTALPLTATFASILLERETLMTGDISMVGQSGGLATVCQAFAEEQGFGFRHMVSTGNEAVLSSADFIHAFAQDPGTKVIAAYLEGVRDGRKLQAALAAARRAGKPVVVLKGGLGAASARAVAAHTGVLAGELRVWDAVLAEEAAIRVESVEELLDVALLLSSTDLAKLPRGKSIGLISFGGGFGVIAADQSARHGLSTPPLAEVSRERLRPLVPPIASIGNPFDLTPLTYNQSAWIERLPEALGIIADDEAIDAVLFLNGPMGRHAAEVCDTLRNLRDRSSKTVCLAWPLAPKGMVEHARAAGFHVFIEFDRATNAIAKAGRYRELLSRSERAAPAAANFDWTAHLEKPAAGLIPEHVVHRVLAAAGLPVAAGEVAGSLEEADAAVGRLGLPLALKGITGAIAHRAKAGLVALDIRSRAELRAAAAGIRERAAAAGLRLDGLYLQRMAAPGPDVLVSAFRDPVFGVMVSCGAGGGLTELIDDVALACAPVDEAAACDLLERLRVVRAAGRLDIAPLAAFVARFSALAAAAPWPAFTLEVNPVRWNEVGVVAVDGLLVTGTP